ncbi:DUF1178 family protein [Salinarimonas sp.]|uniref:DUF1178 family protein n=1 Tax=Salinarimonas sp. TaxID=2766526 RepID=UPI0032D97ED1
MIRYALACDSGHAFESWFPSAAAYDEQAARGLVTCPVCDSATVTKQIMAPSVARTDRAPSRPAAEPEASPPAPASAPAPAPVPAPAPPPALLSEEHQRMRAAIRELRAYVEANAEDVGRSFPEEARRIHAGDAPERFIMGQADRDEIEELIEDGVPIAPLPVLPDERN